MGLVDSGRPQWTMYVPPSAELLEVGPRQASPNPEHDLFESLLVELTDIYGIEVDYYSVNPAFFDKVYGENQNQKFYGPFTTKVIYTPPTDDVGVWQMWGGFSDEVVDSIMIPQYTYWRDVRGVQASPQEGDVLRMKWNISDVTSGHQDLFYEVIGACDCANTFLAHKFSYEVKVKPMRAGEEDNVVIHDTINPLSNTSDTVPISAGAANQALDEEHKEIDAYDDLKSIDELYGYK